MAAIQGQEPPGGWHQPIHAATPSPDPYAVKRGLGRVWGFSVLSFGLYTYFWLYVYRRLLDGELGHGRDDALLHTLLLLVPIANFFVLYWLWRDLNFLRSRIGLEEFPVVPYVIGAVFLAPLFYSLVLLKLNEYWDARTQGLASDAPVTTAEKIVVAAGAAFLALWILITILIVLVTIGLSIAGG